MEDKVVSHCYNLGQDYERLLRHIELKGKGDLEMIAVHNSFNATGALSFRTFLFCANCREKERLENYDQLVQEFSVLCDKAQISMHSKSLTDDQYKKLVNDVERLIEIIETVNSLPMAN